MNGQETNLLSDLDASSDEGHASPATSSLKKGTRVDGRLAERRLLTQEPVDTSQSLPVSLNLHSQGGVPGIGRRRDAPAGSRAKEMAQLLMERAQKNADVRTQQNMPLAKTHGGDRQAWGGAGAESAMSARVQDMLRGLVSDAKRAAGVEEEGMPAGGPLPVADAAGEAAAAGLGLDAGSEVLGKRSGGSADPADTAEHATRATAAAAAAAAPPVAFKLAAGVIGREHLLRKGAQDSNEMAGTASAKVLQGLREKKERILTPSAPEKGAADSAAPAEAAAGMDGDDGSLRRSKRKRQRRSPESLDLGAEDGKRERPRGAALGAKRGGDGSLSPGAVMILSAKAENDIKSLEKVLYKVLQERAYDTKPIFLPESSRRYKALESDIEDYTVEVSRIIRLGDVEGLARIAKSKGGTRGLSVNACNRFGESLLHFAARRSHTPEGHLTFKWLLDNGADAWACDDFGRTPLHDAFWTPEPAFDSVELLMSREPELFLTMDNRGALPLAFSRKESMCAWQQWFAKKIDVLFPDRSTGS